MDIDLLFFADYLVFVILLVQFVFDLNVFEELRFETVDESGRWICRVGVDLAFHNLLSGLVGKMVLFPLFRLDFYSIEARVKLSFL